MKFPHLTAAVLTFSLQSFEVRASMKSPPVSSSSPSSVQNQVAPDIYSRTHTNSQMDSNESGFASSSDDTEDEENNLLSEDTDDDDDDQEEEGGGEIESEEDTETEDEYDDIDHNAEIPIESQRNEDTSPSSQPLKTLKKLQAMLEETDYATATAAGGHVGSTTSSNYPTMTQVNSGILNSETQTQKRRQIERNYPPLPPPPQQAQTHEVPIKKSAPLSSQPEQGVVQDERQGVDQLWTSKDRSKYKKQRKLERERELQRQRMKYLEQQEQQMSGPSDDESHGTDGTEDTDDGLGYTLPNLPVYFSDAESTDDVEDDLMSEKPSMNNGALPSMNQVPPTQARQPFQGPGPQPSQMQQNPINSAKGGNQNGVLQPYEPITQKGPPRQQGQGPPYQYRHQQYQQHQQQYNQHQQPPQQQQQTYAHNQNQYPPQQGPNQGQAPATYDYPYPPPYMYNNPNAYNDMSVHQQYLNQMQQLQQQQHQYQSYPTNQSGHSYPYQPHHYYNQPQQQHQQPQLQQQYQVQRPQPQHQQTQNSARAFVPQSSMPSTPQKVETTPSATDIINANKNTFDQANDPIEPSIDNNPLGQTENVVKSAKAVTLAEAGALITFDAIQKFVTFLLGNFILCYCAVSPRTLGLADYNAAFRKNIQRIMLTMIVPVITMLLVVEVKENDLNSLINTFYAAATLGYTLSFLLEIAVTTIIRLCVFWIWEPSIFDLTPTVPLIILPWTLRDHNYRPKRITLFVADFVASCVTAPIIEEYMKLRVVELSTKLPCNYSWKMVDKYNHSNSKRKSKKRKRKKTLVAVERKHDEAPVTKINSYVSHMLAASLGMKLCDATRRVLMYTKYNHEHKSFYAFFRGFFPIHELCGSMTALELAKRDVLGLSVPLWKLLLPAVGVHGIANLKGMKPIYKWNSLSPWSELQLSPWYNVGPMPPALAVTKLMPKLMWFIIMGRVLGYCIKNYYMIGRKAIKRTDTFADKNASLFGEIRTSDLLRRAKKEKQ